MKKNLVLTNYRNMEDKLSKSSNGSNLPYHRTKQGPYGGQQSHEIVGKWEGVSEDKKNKFVNKIRELLLRMTRDPYQPMWRLFMPNQLQKPMFIFIYSFSLREKKLQLFQKYYSRF